MIQPLQFVHEKPSTLTDQFGRRFDYLRLSITEACNFRCNYCLPDGYCPSSPEAPLSLAEIETLVRVMSKVGTRKIRITGGEPTLRKDLPDIVRICADTPGIEQVAMTSNGYRLHKQLNTLHAAGLKNLNLSADSLDARTFQAITGHDKLANVMKALEDALALGMRVKLNLVLMREYNAGELKHLLAFIKDRPVSVRLIELMRTNDNVEFYTRQHVSGQSILGQLEQMDWQQQAKSALAGPALELIHPDYTGSIGLIMPYSRNFCADCNRLRIAANGNLHMCLFHEADTNLRPYLQQNDEQGLIEHLQAISYQKWAGHQLQDNDSRDTRHLAMLGG